MNKSARSPLRRIFVALMSLFTEDRTDAGRLQSKEEGGKPVTDFFSMMEKLQGMFDSDDIEVITNDGRRFRGRIDNLRSTQPFSKPAVKITSTDGKKTKILFADIKEVIDHRKR
jgi:hypothetical protein